MLKEVENKIEELHSIQKDEYYKQKEIDLENWGLSQRKSGKNSVPLIVTDDEYETIIEASIGVGTSSRNFVSTLLNASAIVVITIGLIVGIIFSINVENLGFVYLSFSVIASFVIALLFRGIAEAIRLLQQLIDRKRSEEFRKVHERQQAFPDEQPEVKPFTNAPPVHYAYPTDKQTVDMPK